MRLETTPAKILTEGGRTAGVLTEAGDVIRARHFVVSGLNPRQTFLDLFKEDAVPREWRDRAARFQYNLIGALFSLNVALREPPHYRAVEKNPHLAKAFMVILGLDDVAAFSDIVRHHEAGTIPPTVMWGATPTVFDPSQAPKGKHTAFMWEKLPYRLRGDPANWDREKEEHGRRLIDFWTEYAPNVRDSIEDWFVRSALDTERHVPEYGGGRSAGRRVHQWAGRVSPAVSGRGALPGPLTGVVSVWLELPSRRKHHGVAGVQLCAGCSLGSGRASNRAVIVGEGLGRYRMLSSMRSLEAATGC